MIKSRFLHIFIKPKEDITVDDIAKEMNYALDWFRYDNSCWVVYSNSSTDLWMTRLEKLVKPTGSLFICKFDINDKNGWMTKKFWAWINKDR